MKDINVNDLNDAVKSEDVEMTADEMGQVKGGGLLLPAVQQVREAARTRSTTTTISYTGLE